MQVSDKVDQITPKISTLAIVLAFLSFLLVVLACLLMYFYHMAVWTLTVNFQIIYFVWILLFALAVGLLIIILSGIAIRKEKNGNKLVLIPPFLVVGLAIFSMSFGLFEKFAYERHYTFSVEKWAVASSDERSVYLDSFLEQYDLYTFNDEMIVVTLGEPDEKRTIELLTDPVQFGGYSYIYDLGFVRDYMDPSFFEITTDQSGGVSNYRIYST